MKYTTFTLSGIHFFGTRSDSWVQFFLWSGKGLKMSISFKIYSTFKSILENPITPWLPNIPSFCRIAFMIILSSNPILKPSTNFTILSTKWSPKIPSNRHLSWTAWTWQKGISFKTLNFQKKLSFKVCFKTLKRHIK